MVENVTADVSTEPASDTQIELADELDQLVVVEAKELQEGIAFHAFQFAC